MEKILYQNRPDWSGMTDIDILNIGKDPLEENRLGYVTKNVIYTSENSNKSYLFTSSKVAPTNIKELRIQEEFLRKAEKLIIHHIGVIRNHTYIDLLPQIHVKLLDNESDSKYGSINNDSKVNIFIAGIELGDIFIYEVGRSEDMFNSRQFLKSYFRSIFALPMGEAAFQKSIFTVINKRPFNILTRVYKKKSVEEAINVIKPNEEYTCEFTEALKKDEFDNGLGCIEFTTESKWEDIVNDTINVYGETVNDVFPLKEIASIESESTLKGKIRAAIEYVQNNIAYRWDYLYMDGYIPEKPLDTFTRKYGDCKAKSLLLKSLLDRLGIESDLVLVNYRFDEYLDIFFPSPFLFNHMIVRFVFEEKEYFIDPTACGLDGDIENRGMIAFLSYLPLRKGIESLHNQNIVFTKPWLEESVNIDIPKLTIDTTLVLRGSIADQRREYLNSTSLENQIKLLTSQIERCLDTNEENYKPIAGVKITELIDDTKKNEIIIKVGVDLNKVVLEKDYFKYYFHDLSFENDEDNLHIRPLRNRKIIIKTHRKIEASTTITKRNCKMENNYFSFSNTKVLSKKMCEVTSIFTPKFNGYIESSERESLKKLYSEINDSNYGIGILYKEKLTFMSAIGNTLRYFLFVIWAMGLLCIVVKRLMELL